jgi:hypothetical protein
LAHLLELGGGGSHLFLHLADAVGVGSLHGDEGILYAFETAGHLQYTLVVSVGEGDYIVAGSDVFRGTARPRTFLGHVGGLRCMRRCQSADGHVEVEHLQRHGGRRVSAQLR